MTDCRTKVAVDRTHLDIYIGRRRSLLGDKPPNLTGNPSYLGNSYEFLGVEELEIYGDTEVEQKTMTNGFWWIKVAE